MPLLRDFLYYFICSILFLLLFQERFVSSHRITEPLMSSYGDACEETITLDKIEGRYNLARGLRNYQDFCVLIVPEDKMTISVKFPTFYERGFNGNNENCSEFLEISDTDGYSSKPPRRYCGFRSPPDFKSTTGLVWIRVHREGTNGFGRMAYIMMSYSSVENCDADIKIDKYTFISSPSHHDRGGFNCNWLVSVENPSGHETLQVQLNNWTKQALGMFGGWAKLSVYDGDEGQILDSFTSSRTSSYAMSKVITTTGPQVRILFSTDEINSFSVFFNATVKVKGFCVPGTLPCGDGVTCYSTNQICDGELQCSSGYDELGCGDCPPTEFWCGKSESEQCYTISERCNGLKNCRVSSQDEINCKTCGPGSYLCKSEDKCIFERWTCDGDFDCSDGSDEQDCSYSASRRVITAAVVGSLVCSLLLVIAIGCTCKLYSLRASHHRHPHHHYRATPLTRVERELFARQAPPTYDMTINGSSTENSSSRSQRSRRRRSRRYQFQRAAPANVGHQSNLDNRQEGTQSPSSRSSSAPQTPNATQSPATTQQLIPVVPSGQSSPGADIAQQLGAFLSESLRSGNQAEGTVPSLRTSTTASSAVTRDNGTQTNATNRNDAQNSSSSSTNQSSSSNGRRSNRSSGRSRSSRGSSSSSKDQQAKPLPKKKRILPVMVPAPFADVAVEEDTFACVYPCPPSYSQAVLSASPDNLNESMESRTDDLEESVSSMENQGLVSSHPEQPKTPEREFSAANESLTTLTKSRFFPFSLGRAIRNIATAPFSRFQKNPYLQMNSQVESRRNSQQDNSAIDEPLVIGNSFTGASQPRPSTSSDEDLLDCAIHNQSPRRDSTDGLLPVNSVVPVTETLTTSTTTGKIFPQRRNLSFFTRRDKTADDTNSLDMSDFTTTAEDM